MTITTSDVLQSFLTVIKDLHSPILHMILKVLSQELRIQKKILVFIILVFKSWGEVANFGFNFSADFSCKQNNATNLTQISTNKWKFKKKLLMSKNGTHLRFWNSLPQKKTRIAAAITTWFQNKLIILDSIIYLRKNVNINKIK